MKRKWYFQSPLAYTSQEIAAKQHVPGNEIAKVVMLHVEWHAGHGRDPGQPQNQFGHGAVELGCQPGVIGN